MGAIAGGGMWVQTPILQLYFYKSLKFVLAASLNMHKNTTEFNGNPQI